MIVFILRPYLAIGGFGGLLQVVDFETKYETYLSFITITKLSLKICIYIIWSYLIS